jgi:hypothetical protein
MARLFVLDQNYLRSEALKILAKERGVKFVLLDEAMYEMCKSAAWEETMRASLHTLADSGSRVVLTKGVGEALRWELQNKASVAGNLVDRAGTTFVRALVSAIANGQDSTEMRLMRERVREAQHGMELQHLNHDENKSRLVEIVKATILDQPDLASALRKGAIPAQERTELIRSQTIQIADHFLREGGGFSAREARRLIRQRGLAFRYCAVRLWYALDWVERQGFEGLKASKATNEMMDHRYVTIASFFNGGLLTRETQMNRCFGDLSAILRPTPGAAPSPSTA